MSEVLVEFAKGVGWITLNRPECMNAVNIALSRELEDALHFLGDRRDVNVIAVIGAGKNFCAGGDFDEVQRLRAEGPHSLRTLFASFRGVCDAIAQVDVPVVAAVQGVAMAGGFELMQAADIVLVSDDARISDNHINFGMIPGGGSTARLARIVGRQGALGLLLSGDRLSGTDAVARGLAYRSFAPAEFDSSVRAFVDKLASRNHDAVTKIKRLVCDGIDHPLAHGLTQEMDQVVRHISGKAGLDSATTFDNREAST